MKLIGLTGPSGAGKTTALRVMERLGAHTIDCDALYHTLLERDELLCEALCARYGTQIAAQDGIDRRALSSIVFADAQAQRDLNEITHPFVARAVDERIAFARAQGYPAAIIDAIALVESGIAARCDHTIAVLAPPQLRHERILQRDPFLTQETAWARIRSQKSDEFYREACDDTIENNGDTADFEYQVQLLYQTILMQGEIET